MNKYLLATLFSFLSLNLLAQKTIEAGVFIGGSLYNGDLDVSTKNFLPQIRPSFGLMTREFLSPSFALRGQYYNISLFSDEAKYATAFYRKERGLSFKTNAHEISILSEWHFIKLNKKIRIIKNKTLFSIYGVGGIGSIIFNPKLYDKTTNTNIENTPLNSQNMNVKLSYALIAGGGFKFLLNENWTINGEISARRAQSDYLEGISGSSVNDYYIVSGLFFTYIFDTDSGTKLFKKRRRSLKRFSVCPTF
jgi:Domain of unknown function (DUF6089)